MSTLAEIETALPKLTPEELMRVEAALHKLQRERKVGIIFDDAYGVRKVQYIPVSRLYRIHAKYAPCTVAARFGGWDGVPAAFAKFAAGKPEWADVLGILSASGNQVTRKKGRRKDKGRRGERGEEKNADKVDDRTATADAASFGPTLALPAMRNAPVNEAGVVYLFGTLAERLGFSVEGVRAAFPDCIAKRRVGPDEWENARIEFEYESRNFRQHRHDPAGCDVIVCWRHNWPDCPENLEVIELRDVVEKNGKQEII